MNYAQAIKYLYSLNMFGGKLGLEREKALLERLGNPQRNFRTILVGGTGGKGSTTVMAASMLQQAGFKTGRFTKPHLSRFSERICVNGKEISEADIARITGLVKRETEKMKEEKPTFFEIVVAIALLYFAEKKVDFAVLEVGMGGRLDATNVCDAPVSIITNVSLEHKEILGKTIARIAYEKAGIIKENGALVTAAKGAALRVLEKVCRERNSKILRIGKEIKFRKIRGDLEGQGFSVSINGTNLGEFSIPLLGGFQLENAACAIGAMKALGLGKRAMRKGLKKVKWHGRMEIVQRKPLVILDCAKDVAALRLLRREIARLGKRAILVISISSDKEWRKMLGEIAPVSDIVIAAEHKVNERALKAEKIAGFAGRKVKTLIVRDVQKAVRKALEIAGKDELVLVTGSVFAVGEAREIWFPAKAERNLNETPKNEAN